ncbi:aminodeoxychorismate synthase component I [Nitrosophilus kaiyonis]|uniref:aminodeoxychorismate synthase component I n=1 Tax=Nitrosophilus kaiyonis TaxID=2930200 RepID=UPI002490981D|nr:aminodeoxychorismate synthase component I [Nitrosophilus kaiyonis]
MDKISFLASKKIPFLFVIDFEGKNIFAEEIDSLKDIYFQIEDIKNFSSKNIKTKPKILKKESIDCEKYKKAFFKVQEEIKKGNTYLLNLTFPTKIKINADLLDIFYASKARFKLYFKDRFVCFSPERFIKIENNKIYTYPMKGTIDAKLPNAKKKILNNEKEMAEHIMVVDLLRNDLSMVSKNVKVKRFRYIEKIKAGEKELLQVSSEIEGELQKNWRENLGSLLKKLLPAGSISGTPKRKTVEIIKEVEGYKRGFFTGVFGIYDGENLDSAVMIRYIEKDKAGYIYKSGGGITIDSNLIDEYKEMIDKVYIPI